MEFAAWLQGELDRLRLSQSELARRSGISQSTWSVLLLGSNKKPPSARVIQALAPVLGYEKDTLLRMWGVIDAPYEMSPEMQGLVEVLDRKLEAIEDPKVKELAITRLKQDITALTDMVESLSEFIDSLPTKDG